MTKKSDTPAIRFKGFTDTWEQRKLGELVDRVVRKNINNESTLPLTISAQYGLVDQITYFNNRVASRDVSNYYLVLNGEFAYNKSTSDGYPFGAVKRLDLYEKGVLSTLYIVFAPKKEQQIDSDYLTVFFDTDRWHKGVAERAAEGARNHGLLNISAEDFFDIDLSVPKDIVEQKQIGAFIRQLDNLITLHQRKYDKLTNVKKSMLEKMFPKNGSNVPEIRFKGFTEAWEQRKLSEIATMHARIGWQNLRTSEFLDSGDYMLITGTDFIDGAVNFDTCHYVERERYEQDKHIQIRNGSILITKDGTLGKVAYIQGLTMPATLNAGVFNVEIKDENEVDNRYLFQYLKAPFLMDYVDKKATGGTIKHLNQNILVDFPVVLPHKAEQEKIGEYFLAIDHLITLHQRKCQIDGCRFQSPLAITWEQRKFDEVFDCTVPNNTLSRAELSYDEGTVLNVHYGDVLIKYGSVLDVQKDDIPRIPYRCREDFNGALLQDGDVIIADTAEDETTGKACEIGNLQGRAIVSGLHTMVCRPRHRMALGYLGHYLNSNAYHHQLLPLMQGIKVLSLSRSNIQKTSVSYPTVEKEQQLIANYFSQLDNLITLHQCE